MITSEEHTLANELKSLCSGYGEERRATLPQSAELLMQLGNVYTQKAAENQDAMSQKITFIQSCALLNGAKVRFQTCHDEKKVMEADDCITALICKIFEKFDVRAPAPDFLNFTDNMLKTVQTIRKEAAEELDQVSKIEDSVSGQERQEKEIEKIHEIRELYDRTTEKYRKLMKGISEMCVQILGEAPCEYAGVGLGSLARNEITLYSDFEHVIILQEGVQNQKNFETIREYFRRFAVLFQVVLINLGETFIRSVGVPCLNDLYSGDPSKDWYYDNHTPCGISFDGMVPHSCHNPLGRQQSTKARKHIVELIQPVSEMAKYLSSTQGVKNGYYLKDILTRTCFVYGSRKLHSVYIKAAEKILLNEEIRDVAEDLIKKIDENVNRSMAHEPHKEAAARYVDTKSQMYRPITGLLSYLGRIHGIFVPSTHDLIGELCRKNIINDKACHDLQYAVAIACEVRSRVYTDGGQQRYRISPSALLNIISVKTHCDFSEILRRLRVFTKESVSVSSWLKGGIEHFLKGQHLHHKFDFRPCNPTSKIWSLMELNRYEEAMKQCEQCDLHLLPDDLATLGSMCRLLGREALTEANWHLDQAEGSKYAVPANIPLPTSRNEEFDPRLAATLFRKKLQDIKSDSLESNILSLLEEESYTEAAASVEKNDCKLDMSFWCVTTILCEYGQAKEAKKTSDKWWKKGEKILKRVLDNGLVNKLVVIELAYIYRHQKRYKEAHLLLQKYCMTQMPVDHDIMPEQNVSAIFGIEIQIKRHMMPTKAFLEYLEQNLSSANHIEARLRILREIAMAQIKLQQSNIAKGILRDLVYEINTNVRKLRKGFAVWFLKKIMKIQRDHKWTEDALETVDIMEDLMRDGCSHEYISHTSYPKLLLNKKASILLEAGWFDAVIKMYKTEVGGKRSEYHDFYISWLLLRKSYKEASTQVKLDLIKSAIKICEKHRDSEKMRSLYAKAFCMILEAESLERNQHDVALHRFAEPANHLFPEVVQMYCSAPFAVKSHKSLRVRVGDFVHRHIRDLAFPITCGDLHGLAFDRVHTLFEHFSKYLLEMNIFSACMVIRQFVSQTKNDDSLLKLLEELRIKFVLKFSVKGGLNSVVKMRYNMAVECFPFQKLHGFCASTSWWVINNADEGTVPHRISIALLYSVIQFYK